MGAIKTWKRWVTEAKVENNDIYSISNEDFALLMESFIFTVRQHDGTPYANASLKTLCANLNRERNLGLTGGQKKCDFKRDPLFKNARDC